MTPGDIEQIDRQFMRNQELARIGERTQQIWPIFLTMAGGFGFAGLQSNEGGYIIVLFPILVGCLAQHVNDSELTLKKNRKFLYQQEEDAGCTGGSEHYFQEHAEGDGPKGGNKKALRRGFVLSSLLAIYLLLMHMQRDHVPFLFILLIGCAELFFTWQTFSWLTYWKPILIWLQSSRLFLWSVRHAAMFLHRKRVKHPGIGLAILVGLIAMHLMCRARRDSAEIRKNYGEGPHLVRWQRSDCIWEEGKYPNVELVRAAAKRKISGFTSTEIIYSNGTREHIS